MLKRSKKVESVKSFCEKHFFEIKRFMKKIQKKKKGQKGYKGTGANRERFQTVSRTLFFQGKRSTGLKMFFMMNKEKD